MGLGLIIVQTLYFLLPAYVANMSPVFIRRLPFSWIKKPMSERLLGKNKTWAGLIGGILVGSFLFLLQRILYDQSFFQTISIVNYITISPWLGVLLAAGAMLGDATKSFFKRKADVAPGKSWPPFDQLDFVVGAFLAAAILYVPPAPIIIAGLLISPLLHVLVNFLGYSLKLQKNKL